MSAHGQPTDAELAGRVLGQLSPARTAEVDAWIASDPMNRDRAEAIRLVVTTNSSGGPRDHDRLWSNVRHAMRREPARRAPRFPWETALRAAGIVGVLGAAAVYSRHLVLRPGLKADAGAGRSAPGPEYATARGQRATVRLSDGSEVTLAAESHLRVGSGYGEHERVVELEGEGAFTVVHDSTRPFRVRAGGAVVTDVGTRFDLRAYPGDAGARVAVAEGAVTLGAGNDSAGGGAVSATRAEGLLIRRGQVGRLDTLGHAMTSAIGNDVTFFGWTAGRLSFEREPLRDVVASIARWYDIDVRVPDAALAGREVTAEFSTQSATDMIHALAQAVHAQVTGSGRTLTLIPQ